MSDETSPNPPLRPASHLDSINLRDTSTWLTLRHLIMWNRPRDIEDEDMTAKPHPKGIEQPSLMPIGFALKNLFWVVLSRPNMRTAR